MARDISSTNVKIQELTSLVKEKSFKMNTVISEVG